MAVELNLGKIKKTDAELKADVQEIVGDMGGAGGGFDVLWKSPNDAMTAISSGSFTLDVPITDYRIIEVVLRLTNSVSTYTLMTRFWKELEACRCFQWNPTKGIYYRDLLFNYREDPKAVYCNPCYLATSFGGSGSQASSFLLPWYVLGYK